jgi:hypothetical protein
METIKESLNKIIFHLVGIKDQYKEKYLYLKMVLKIFNLKIKAMGIMNF